ncbi:GPI ethanolamine phosphate transferase 1 isoform X2 [Belonocnema kinseyi]|nr:GPI ethanolamine phosphate transferase 1 isoform X2 [Belonocnema kinseyi]XP_033216193.1 GPI ethanolamine phosphate transferase 1 isoform X2 [Belonocnema kinseyi]
MKLKNEGVWGISHARMPTESRPGNIAIVAGLYEDPSALFKGWKENPVEFDSVFNQSYMTWGWGSPDIISLFSKGSNRNFMGKSYPSSWQDFDTSTSTIRLDSWVFERFLQWLKYDANAVKDQDNIIIFFHLLGCDTAGHASKPRSKDYVQNLKYIDWRIQEIVQKTEEVFEPGTTAYLFTSDHGMTDWGSHGSGSKDETETPFVAWGAGISNNSERQDIEQADITPFISTLLGQSIPVNNEGVLNLKLLSPEIKEYGARAFLRNIKQLVLQVKANRELSLGSNDISTHWRDEELHKRIHQIEALIREGKIPQSMDVAEKTVLLAKESLYYFRQYQRNRFMLYLTFMWFGWIALLFLKVAGKPRRDDQSFKLYLLKLGFLGVIFIMFIEYIVSGYRDARLLLYGTVAIFSMWLAIREAIVTAPLLEIQKCTSPQVGVIMIMVLIVIMFAGLIYRTIFSFAMCYAVLLQKVLIKDSHPWLLWTGFVLAIFPSLPVVEPQPRIIIVFISLCLAGVACCKRKSPKILKLLEVLRLILTGLVCMEYLEGRSWISWTILISTPICIWAYSLDSRQRIIGAALHLLCPLALLSASYEPVFFLTLAGHLLCWPLAKEQRELEGDDKHMSMQDLARAASLMLYTLLCFFGTGNMASISSFDPGWTRHFVTIFSPFTMMFLILFKIMIPLILVGCASRACASSTVFLGVLLLGDCLALPLMYGITNQGSWLDIGSAISRFTIAITLPCLLLILYYLAHPLMTVKIPASFKNAIKKASLRV